MHHLHGRLVRRIDRRVLGDGGGEVLRVQRRGGAEGQNDAERDRGDGGFHGLKLTREYIMPRANPRTAAADFPG